MKTPEEASSDSRQFARALRDIYVAMLAEGFTPPEAMGVVANIVQATFSAQLGGQK